MQQLPVIESVKDAIGYTMSNITLLVKASMFWVALYTIIVAFFSFMGGDAYMLTLYEFSQVEFNPDAANPFEPYEALLDKLASYGGLVSFLYLCLMVIGVMAYYSIAIAWHRACLLDEVPPLVRLGRLEFKYFGYTILLGVGLYVVFILLGYVVGLAIDGIGLSNPLGAAYLAILILVVMLFLAFGRFSLAFPGIAVRDRRMNFKSSWQASVGNSWRILGGTILCFIPALVISYITALIGVVDLPLVIYMPIAMVLQLLSGAFLLSYMSICYQFLVPSPDVGDLA